MKRPWLAALMLAACATSMISVWKKPGAGPLQFQKVAVLAMVKDDGMRREVEEQIAGSVRSSLAVPMYRLPVTLSPDRGAVMTELRREGFDGAVVVDITGVDHQQTWVPGSSSPMWPVYDPGYMRTDTYVRVRTSIYSVADQELVFSATSRTANPADLRELIDETTAAVTDELKRQGLSPAQPVSAR